MADPAPEFAAQTPAGLIDRLREDLVLRRIGSGMARLESCRTLIDSLDPTAPNAAGLLGYLAQWVDIGFGDPALVKALLGDKTFQQMTEEFAAIVIPKVWEREERKVSRVAARLSISPKKVRRILAKMGLSAGPGLRS